jgi:hypothetical protein
MHSSRHLQFLLVPAITAFAACGGPADSNDPAAFGSAEIHLTAAPSDVYCLRVQASGSRFVEKTVDVLPGQSTVFTMTGLPTGNVTFSGDAFNQSCSMIMGATATWVADPVATSVQSSIVTQVNLNMKRNGQANVSVDFQEDPTTSCMDGTQNGTETGIDCGGGACPPCNIGATCMVASDCVAPSICQGGVCVSGAGCMTNADCPAPNLCQNGQCVSSPVCMVNADCPPGTVCNGGVCGGTPACTSNAECPAGTSCQNGICVNTGGTCHVVINEVQVAGFGGSGDEFIELYNPCMSGVDLLNYRVMYRSAVGVTDVTLANLSGLFVPPGGFVLLASSMYTGGGPIEYMYPADSLSANGGGIGLLDANNVTVDSVGYGSATNIYVETAPAVAPPMGQSIGRMPNGNDTNNNQIDFLMTFPTPHMPN